MAIAGANFALMYRAFVRRQPRAFVRDEEFRLYVALVLVASAALTAMLWGYGIAEGEAAIRAAVFQTVSIMTTTGMASADFALWPPLLLLALFALMFVGGSAGSTGGSIKVVRHLLLGKVLRREVDQTLSPEFVMPIRLNGSPVDERTRAGDRGVHPPLRRVLGRGRVDHRDRLGDLRRPTRDARLARRVGDHARQRRPRLRHRRAVRLVRRVTATSRSSR